jgi:hypothetical protein
MDFEAYLNAILSFIGSASLTEEEFDSLTVDSLSSDLEIYAALLSILNARDMVSTQQDRLFWYYKAKGVEVSQPSQAKSNIFVGATL